MSDELKRINVRLTPELHEWYRLKSEKTGVSMNALMFMALESHAQQQEMLPHIPEIIHQVKGVEDKDK